MMTDKVILFDLDGTLLPMDTDGFIDTYIQELAGRVSHIVEPEIFVKALLGGTKAMMSDLNPERTNEQVFEETFLSMSGVNKEEIWPVLDEFYDTTFPTFSYLCEPTSLAREVVEEAIAQGFKVAVATNPVFPRTAINHRLSWAGLQDLPFELVTVYEESMFTKPHKEYYEFIAEQLGTKPAQCVMAGNDVQEDLAASKAGMKTFLVKGCVIDRGEPQFKADDEGTLDELLRKLRNHESVFGKS